MRNLADDMYEDEMDMTTSVQYTTVLSMTSETTSPVSAAPTSQFCLFERDYNQFIYFINHFSYGIGLDDDNTYHHYDHNSDNDDDYQRSYNHDNNSDDNQLVLGRRPDGATVTLLSRQFLGYFQQVKSYVIQFFKGYQVAKTVFKMTQKFTK